MSTIVLVEIYRLGYYSRETQNLSSSLKGEIFIAPSHNSAEALQCVGDCAPPDYLRTLLPSTLLLYHFLLYCLQLHEWSWLADIWGWNVDKEKIEVKQFTFKNCHRSCKHHLLTFY